MNKKFLPILLSLTMLSSCNKTINSSRSCIITSTPPSSIPEPTPEPEPEITDYSKYIDTKIYSATDSEGNKIKYLSIISLNDTSLKKLVIPTQINGLTIKKIENGAFKNCNNLAYVYIPETIEEIGYYSSMNDDTYYKYNEYSAFVNMPNLTSIEVDKNNKNYFVEGNCLIEKKENNTQTTYEIVCGFSNVEIPSNITSLRASCFRGNTSITSIKLHNKIQSIGKFAICGIPKLNEVSITDQTSSLYKIENNILYKSDDNTIVCGWKDITIPNFITELNEYCFFNNLTIGNVTTHDDVTIINYNAFAYSSLKTINLGKSVSKIYKSTFENISTLEEITVSSENTYYSIPKINGVSSNFVVENKSSNLLIGWKDTICPSRTSTQIIDMEFTGMSSMTSIVLPDNITTIKTGAFKQTNLKSIHITEKISEIVSDAFSDIPDLQTITCDSNNTTFEARNNCLIRKDGQSVVLIAGKDIVLPSGVTYIDSTAIPSYINSIKFNNELETIGYLFNDSSKVTSIYIPASVTSISGFGPSSMPSFSSPVLKEVKIDENNKKYYVKDNCIMEKNDGKEDEMIFAWGDFTIPEMVTTIGAGYLYYCNAITSLTIHNKITDYTSYSSFEGLTSLKLINYKGTKEEFLNTEFSSTFIDKYPNITITFSDDSSCKLYELELDD